MNIPGYKLERRIGRGGMAMVYRAVQESLARPVALKVLNPVYADSPEFSKRFINEGRMLASLRHANVITIHDIGVHDSLHYISMELVEGGDLKRRMAAGIDPETALDYVRAIAGALRAAHAQDIVHRDIKPANVMFRKDGTLLLTDFGIAKQLGVESDVTVAGSTIGSPSYLSPEQARALPVDARADIYSLGIVLYEMLVGEKPYQADSDIETVLRHINDPIPNLPERLRGAQPLLDRMIAKSRDDRFDNVAELIDAVEEARVALGGLDSRPRNERSAPAVSGDSTTTSTVAARGEEATMVLDSSTAPRQRVPVRATGGRWKWIAAALGSAALIVLAGVGIGALIFDVPPAPVTAPVDVGHTAELEQAAPAAPQAGGAESTPAVVSATPPVPEVGASSAGQAGAPGVAEPATPENVLGSTAAPGQEPAVVAVPTEPLAAPVEAPAAPAPDAEAQETASLLAAAERAMEKDRLTRPAGDNAREYFEQVLAIDPGNERASAGFIAIAERYASLARGQLARRDYDKADDFVARGLAVDKDNQKLLSLRAEIARRRAAVEQPASAEQPARRRGEIQGESPAELLERIKGFFK